MSRFWDYSQMVSVQHDGYISTEKIVDAVIAEVKKINDIDTLIKIKDAIKIAKDSSEILLLIKQS